MGLPVDETASVQTFAQPPNDNTRGDDEEEEEDDDDEEEDDDEERKKTDGGAEEADENNYGRDTERDDEEDEEEEEGIEQKAKMKDGTDGNLIRVDEGTEDITILSEREHIDQRKSESIQANRSSAEQMPYNDGDIQPVHSTSIQIASSFARLSRTPSPPTPTSPASSRRPASKSADPTLYHSDHARISPISVQWIDAPSLPSSPKFATASRALEGLPNGHTARFIDRRCGVADLSGVVYPCGCSTTSACSTCPYVSSGYPCCGEPHNSICSRPNTSGYHVV